MASRNPCLLLYFCMPVNVSLTDNCGFSGLRCSAGQGCILPVTVLCSSDCGRFDSRGEELQIHRSF
jgi:hypothetical protein